MKIFFLNRTLIYCLLELNNNLFLMIFKVKFRVSHHSCLTVLYALFNYNSNNYLYHIEVEPSL